MRIIDISQELLTARVYEGDPAPKVESLSNMENGDLYNLSALSMCLHNGTHIDAPSHFIKGGKTVDKMPIDAFVGKCFVAEHEGEVSAEDAAKILEKAKLALAAKSLKKGTESDAAERILLKGNLTVTEEAARVFAESKIKLLGNEGQTVGPKDAPMAVHLILLEKEIILLEGIVLTDAHEGVYFLSAAPLNIKGAEGSPCRAWLAEI
jgi:arylformamidase